MVFPGKRLRHEECGNKKRVVGEFYDPRFSIVADSGKLQLSVIKKISILRVEAETAEESLIGFFLLICQIGLGAREDPHGMRLAGQ